MNAIKTIVRPVSSSLNNHRPLRALHLQNLNLHTRAQLLSYIYDVQRC